MNTFGCFSVRRRQVEPQHLAGNVEVAAVEDEIAVAIVDAGARLGRRDQAAQHRRDALRIDRELEPGDAFVAVVLARLQFEQAVAVDVGAVAVGGGGGGDGAGDDLALHHEALAPARRSGRRGIATGRECRRTSATRPATLSETMRRVRLEKLWLTKNCQPRRATPRSPLFAIDPPSGPRLGTTGKQGTFATGDDAPARMPRRDAGVSAACDWFRRFDRAMGSLPRLPLACSSSTFRGAGSDASEGNLKDAFARSASVGITVQTKGAQSFLEAVADAVERFDHVEVVVDGLEFLAQPLDVAVDGAVVDIDLVVVGGIHQRVAAFHHAGAGGQRLQDQEFGDGQRDRLVLPGAGVPLRVHAQLAALERLDVGLLRRGGRVLGTCILVIEQ